MVTKKTTTKKTTKAKTAKVPSANSPAPKKQKGANDKLSANYWARKFLWAGKGGATEQPGLGKQSGSSEQSAR